MVGFPKKVASHTFHRALYIHNKRNISHGRSSDVPKVIYVDPQRILYSTIPRVYRPTKGKNAFIGVLGGIWDRFTADFENTTVYKSLQKRFVRGYNWEQTEIYQNSLSAIEVGASAWNDCRSESDLKDRCEYLDKLFRSIKQHGYQPNASTIIERGACNKQNVEDFVVVNGYCVPDEIRIGVGRHGEYIRLGGGRHRLTIARILNLDYIPVVIIMTHKNAEQID